MKKIFLFLVLLSSSVFLFGYNLIINDYIEANSDINKSKYLSGNFLYDKNNSKYFQDGKPFFDKISEKKILNLFKNQKKIRILVDKQYLNLFDNFFSDINNCIYVDKKTHKKDFVLGKNDLKISEVLGKSLGCEPAIDESFYQCIMWKQLADVYISKNKIESFKEKDKIYELYKQRHIFYDINFSLDVIAYSYLHKNICKRILEINKWKKEHINNSNNVDIYELEYLNQYKGRCK